MINNTFTELTDIIHRRRSIFPKTYTGETVEKQLILKILSNAIQAPTHKHTEPWRFHVISGEMKNTLAEFLQDCYKTQIPPKDFQERKFKKLKFSATNSSHIIVIGMKRDPEASVPEWEEVAAVACAVQNIYLSVTAAGLGGYWSSSKLLINNIPQLINQEENERCLGCFYIGVPIDNLELSVEKSQLETRMKWYG